MNDTDRFRSALFFTIKLLPVFLIASYCTALYTLDTIDPATIDQVIAQFGSRTAFLAVQVSNPMFLSMVAAFFGYLLAGATGLKRPLRFDRPVLLRTLVVSLVAGVLFSLDYWVFGAFIPAIREAASGSIPWYTWVSHVLYGGIVEEILLRWFAMSLITWILWKLFARRETTVPDKLLIAANVVAALLFAAAHLPATAASALGITPVTLLRCLLVNGGYGLLFGRLYRRYGIQYAMLCHALVHVVADIVMTVVL
ncbi:MAG: CPBP family intramembrane metalloprotease [Mogibacterium sp.]|nr:CPBP family intramembrane metalloprotease [Mogibacterium sp.]